MHYWRAVDLFWLAPPPSSLLSVSPSSPLSSYSSHIIAASFHLNCLWGRFTSCRGRIWPKRSSKLTINTREAQQRFAAVRVRLLVGFSDVRLNSEQLGVKMPAGLDHVSGSTLQSDAAFSGENTRNSCREMSRWVPSYERTHTSFLFGSGLWSCCTIHQSGIKTFMILCIYILNWVSDLWALCISLIGVSMA